MSMQWNLDQLRVFIAVAEQRSFSAVARQQRKAQSAISSAIAMLEDDLGVSLFERSSGRQPRLTEAGEALLEEAREVLRQCERLNGRAMAMMRGQEAQLRVAQDEAMPYQALVESFGALADQFPSLEVQLTSAAQGEVARKLVERRADLGLLFYHDEIPEALERRVLGSVEMVTVCGINHPLATQTYVTCQQLAQHRQLLMSTQTDSEWTPPALVVELVWRRDEPLGPAARWLAERFAVHLRAIDGKSR